MTTFEHTTPANPQIDPSLTVGAVDPAVEFLRQGRQRLGESLAVVSQQGEAAVGEYMSSLLADTHGEAPADERTAAFDVLGRAQKVRNYEGVATKAVEVLPLLDKADATAAPRIQDKATRITGLSTAVQDAHRAVFRPLKAKDTGPLVRLHEQASNAMRGLAQATNGISGEVNTWSQHSNELLGGLRVVSKQALAHDQAISSANASLKPGYEGEAKDLRRVIDEAVVAEVSSALTEALRVTEPAAAVESIVDSGAQQSALRKARAIDQFIKEYDALLKEGPRFKNIADDVAQKTAHYVGRGNDTYRTLRHDDEQGIYTAQTTLAEGVSGASRQAANSAQSMLQAAARERSGVGKQIA